MRRYFRPLFPLLSLALIGLVLAGCWSRREIEELALIMAAALDAEGENQVRLSVFIINPREIGGGQPMGAGGGGSTRMPGEIVTAVADNFAEATRRLEEHIPRRVFWAHNRVIILGDGLARRGLQSLDWFSRDRQMRLDTVVIITEGEARRVLDLPPGIELNPGSIITGILNSHVILRVELKDLFAMWQAKGDNPVVPRVVLLSPEEHSGSKTQGGGDRQGGASQGGEGGGEGQKQEMDGPAAIRFDGAGVFKDDKLVGYLNHLETLGTMWLRGEVREGVITFNCPAHPEGQVAVRFYRTQTKVKPQVTGDKISFMVKITAEGDLTEHTCPDSLKDPAQLKVMEDALRRELERRVQAALNKAQKELKVDMFGFGEVLHREQPKLWRQVQDNWNEIFAGVEVRVESQMEVRRVGMTYASVEAIRGNTSGKETSPGGR
ncbi:MAG: Ger(x)C family spore germination protein [Thermoanaerobacteraceae bacterium]|nr:Ger(x)C family spore germination protein [Thermoanaerobacteraceae bacterium]